MQVLSLRFKPVTTRNSNIILTYLSNISSAHSCVAIWEKQKQEIFHKTLTLPSKINTALKRIQIRYFFRYKHMTPDENQTTLPSCQCCNEQHSQYPTFDADQPKILHHPRTNSGSHSVRRNADSDLYRKWT